jgi:hypothetical protein
MPRRKKENRTQSRERHAIKLTTRLKKIGELPPINPDMTYRPAMWPLFLGLELPQIREQIKAGIIEKPVKLSGVTEAYYGTQLLRIKEKRMKEVA